MPVPRPPPPPPPPIRPPPSEAPAPLSVPEATSVSAAPLLGALGQDPLGSHLAALYAERLYAPFWVEPAGLTPRGRLLLDTLGRAPEEGLDSGAYDLESIGQRLQSGTVEDRLVAEALISRATARFFLDRLLGQTRRLVSFDEQRSLLQREEGRTLQGLLADAAAAPSLPAMLASLEPRSLQYRRLIGALAHAHKQHAAGARRPASGGEPALATMPGPSIRPGDQDPRVPLVRRRLGGGGGASPVYDATLVDAVRAFQSVHGLTPDGILGRETLSELAHGPAVGVDRLRLALERWRLLPRNLGSIHLLVNVPQYELFVYEGQREALRMRVAVGRPNDPTPLFSDDIDYMEFNPYWNVPASIAREEVLPRQAEDPAYLARRGFTLVPRDAGQREEDAEAVSARSYRLRQDPGPNNPLGTVKFMFPNKYAVYLHDTNAPRVFGRSFRAVSHGCVRVQEPAALADYLLGRFTARPGQTALSFKGTRPRVVRLAWPAPVHLTYFTAWIDAPGGPVRYSPDVYEQDPPLVRRLEDSVAKPGSKETMAAR
ncbi:L,D-transpeptidase family protein [Pararhodospirillum photometricum]|nr:L,D-transpeptidase family protein [Pararhodospirillum photometricum]